MRVVVLLTEAIRPGGGYIPQHWVVESDSVRESAAELPFGELLLPQQAVQAGSRDLRPSLRVVAVEATRTALQQSGLVLRQTQEVRDEPQGLWGRP